MGSAIEPVPVPPDVTWRDTFLAYLVGLHGWRSGAELGVKDGKTIGHLLRHCPDLSMIGVDTWQPMPGHEGPEDWADWPHDLYERRARDRCEPFADRAILIKATTTEAAKHVPEGSLDFVFIDADHAADAVRADILNWRSKVRRGGWLIGHDIDWPSVRQAVESLLPQYRIGPNVCWACPID